MKNYQALMQFVLLTSAFGLVDNTNFWLDNSSYHAQTHSILLIIIYLEDSWFLIG
jgi:hypothetical protein